MTIPLHTLTDHCFPGEEDVIGRYAEKANDAARAVAVEIKQARRPYLRLPKETGDLAEILKMAEYIRLRFQHLVVVGTGGSSLGARCLSALAPLDANPRLHFLENADPHHMASLMRWLPIERSAFLFISKSGGTLETLSQALLITAEIERRLDKADVARACTVITEPKDSALRRLAQHYGMKILDHDPDLGGRFSVLGNVGLLPVACLGLDIAAVRAGAATLVDSLEHHPAPYHPAVQGALFQYHHMTSGKNIHVMMPYSDRLKLLGDWFRQLTAESLGKDGHGFTPLAALGTVDHHSMLQLFLDGPNDKFFTFVTLEKHYESGAIDSALAEAVALPMLAGKSLGDVIAAAARGTIETVAAHHLPVREIVLSELTEHSLGALLMQFELETALTAQLMRVDAYDQPAVEESKQRTVGHLKAA